MLIYSISLSIILIPIFIQDFLMRRVMVIVFFAQIIVSGVWHISVQNFENFLVSLGINIFFISLQLLILALYFKIAGCSIKNKMGSGDIVFLYSICFLFSPLNFFLFYTCSLALTLVLHIIFLRYKLYYNSDNTIPLAGWQALLLFLVIICSTYFEYDIFSDETISGIINKEFIW